jgi:hypothetical protein
VWFEVEPTPAAVALFQTQAKAEPALHAIPSARHSGTTVRPQFMRLIATDISLSSVYQVMSRTLPSFLSALCVMSKPLLGTLPCSKLKNIRIRCPARRRLVRRSKAKQI